MDGHEFADKKLFELAKEIRRIYAQAAKESEQRLAEFLDTFNETDKEKRKAVKDGKLSEKSYKAWRQREFTKGENYIAVRDSIAEQVADSAGLAVAAVNGKMADVYAENLNYSHFMTEKGTGFNLAFDLISADTLQVLAANGHKLVPNADFVRNKCVSWNKRQIAGQIGIGILLGEPIPAIAKRMRNVTGMNARNSIMTARTLTTAAENAGRLKGFDDAKKLGVRMKQEWLATLDVRTRDSHRHVDGEKVEVGAKFSNGLRFPGDPDAPYSETANCRCTLIGAVDGVDTSDAERWSKLPEGMTYEQWKGQREKDEQAFYDWQEKHLDPKPFGSISKKQAGVIFRAFKEGRLKAEQVNISMMYARYVSESKPVLTANWKESSTAEDLRMTITALFEGEDEFANRCFQSFLQSHYTHFQDDRFKLHDPDFEKRQKRKAKEFAEGKGKPKKAKDVPEPEPGERQKTVEQVLAEAGQDFEVQGNVLVWDGKKYMANLLVYPSQFRKAKGL